MGVYFKTYPNLPERQLMIEQLIGYQGKILSYNETDFCVYEDTCISISMTSTKETLYFIRLNSGVHIWCTEDTEFYLTDFSTKKAKDLIYNDKLFTIFPVEDDFVIDCTTNTLPNSIQSNIDNVIQNMNTFTYPNNHLSELTQEIPVKNQYVYSIKTSSGKAFVNNLLIKTC